MQSNLREQATFNQTFQAAEVRKFRPFNTHRNNRCTRLRRDKTRAIVDFHQRACSGDASFRENHHWSALFHQTYQMFNSHRLRRVERNKVDK